MGTEWNTVHLTRNCLLKSTVFKDCPTSHNGGNGNWSKGRQVNKMPIHYFMLSWHWVHASSSEHFPHTVWLSVEFNKICHISHLNDILHRKLKYCSDNGHILLLMRTRNITTQEKTHKKEAKWSRIILQYGSPPAMGFAVLGTTDAWWRGKLCLSD